MRPVLQSLTGKSAGTVYALAGPRVRIGRHPDCDIVIGHESVSRFHAQVVREGEDVWIEDLGSRNRTFLNERVIEGRLRLSDNDRIRVCDALFVFRVHGTASEAVPVSTSGIDQEGSTSTIVTAIAVRDPAMGAVVTPEFQQRGVPQLRLGFGQSLDPDRIYPKIVDSLFAIFPEAERALVVLLDARDRVIARCARHRVERNEPVRFSRTIIRKAISERQGLLSIDALSDPQFHPSKSLPQCPIRSVMCAPLLSADKTPLGAVQVDTQSDRSPFDENDLEKLMHLANQAAILIESARMVERIREHDRIVRELMIAREVQGAFLPRSLPQVAGYEFWAFCEPAGHVGGDFYDCLPLPDGRQALVLGDVSGKGVPAALLMAKVICDTRVALLRSSDSPARALTMLNQEVYNASFEGKFITMLMCVLDPVRHRIALVNAGHHSPMIRRAAGTIEEPAGIEVSGMPIGIMPDVSYNEIEVRLDPGDLVLLFTDGVSDAMNARNRVYTRERIRQIVRAAPAGATQLGQHLVGDVDLYLGDSPQTDDISVLVFGRTAGA